ncbi:phage baseplate protein [Klebsiella oxytoca]|uniref:phage baseplate protein n=1 Tax=Klebsiella oxytoca TaxID=571 RepID=UPI0025946916|nr:hypothetical protein [Klebsiella oxytoca]MDM4397544.1 hypothetical protein [Klebsiella oxytoca]MDM4421140.1 hypothetical protein [Klebsiella oxytoca]MDM4452900.1 hypothetical protein [Klebsiella oxytoca]MDM4563101.1 hypothetical protein [Klebsiella oxytoca]MDM4626568.1 hypothetical protein [Klebsiella oxytoca]
MQTLMPTINTESQEFRDGNPLTKVKGTIVPALFMNNIQGAVRDTQSEILSVLSFASLDPDGDDQTQLLQAIKKIISLAVVTNVYPIGSVKFFASNVNPNSLFTGTTWTYIGEDRVIRLGGADGSDVLDKGGSDTVSILKSHLPAVRLSLTGETDVSAEQNLQTKEGGLHKHQGGMDGPGDAWDDNYIVGSDNDSHRKRNYTSEDGQHIHNMVVPAHYHDLTGNTELMGEGLSVDIKNKFVKLMGWYRSA